MKIKSITNKVVIEGVVERKVVLSGSNLPWMTGL